MYNCLVCRKEFDNERSIGHHIKTHKISGKDYYDKYLKKENDGICPICSKPTSFIKLSKGYHEFCSISCMGKSDKIRNKKKNTCIKNIGVENPSQSSIIKNKKEETCLKNYGVRNPSQANIIKIKKEETCLKNYGVKYGLQSEIIKEKTKQTNLERYGVINPYQSKVIQEDYKKTMLNRYGVCYPLQERNILKYRVESNRHLMIKKIKNLDRLNYNYLPNFDLNDYNGIEKRYSWKCIKCKTIFDDHLNDGHIPRCPNCFPKTSSGSSNLEKEIYSFVKNYYPNSIENDRTNITPKELDIFIPEINLAIEFDGLYWHSELNGKNNNYHLHKTELAKEKGIQLLHIFEDEWLEKQDIVKSILLAKLGKIENKIYARKCEIRKVPNKDAKQFLFDNHLQGEINGKHFGLYHNHELVSILTIGKSRFNKKYDWEILRFCNKNYTTVVGGYTKLLNHFRKNCSGSIITYVDKRYSDGKLYNKIGFEKVGESKPNYYYTTGFDRKSRIKYQKHKLKDKLKLFDQSLTEWQNMQLNGYDRIWDCGNYIFEYL